jgi:hypothetical protein
VLFAVLNIYQLEIMIRYLRRRSPQEGFQALPQCDAMDAMLCFQGLGRLLNILLHFFIYKSAPGL